MLTWADRLLSPVAAVARRLWRERRGLQFRRRLGGCWPLRAFRGAGQKSLRAVRTTSSKSWSSVVALGRGGRLGRVNPANLVRPRLNIGFRRPKQAEPFTGTFFLGPKAFDSPVRWVETGKGLGGEA